MAFPITFAVVTWCFHYYPPLPLPPSLSRFLFPPSLAKTRCSLHGGAAKKGPLSASPVESMGTELHHSSLPRCAIDCSVKTMPLTTHNASYLLSAVKQQPSDGLMIGRQDTFTEMVNPLFLCGPIPPSLYGATLSPYKIHSYLQFQPCFVCLVVVT